MFVWGQTSQWSVYANTQGGNAQCTSDNDARLDARIIRALRPPHQQLGRCAHLLQAGARILEATVYLGRAPGAGAGTLSLSRPGFQRSRTAFDSDRKPGPLGRTIMRDGSGPANFD